MEQQEFIRRLESTTRELQILAGICDAAGRDILIQAAKSIREHKFKLIEPTAR